MAKRMRRVSRSAIRGVYPIHLRPPGTHSYYYGPYKPDDSLDELLANKVHRDVKAEATRRAVSDRLSVEMDIGIRVNRALAAHMGVSSAASATGVTTPRFLPETSSRDIAFIVIGTPLTDKECDDAKVRLVALRWDGDA